MNIDYTEYLPDWYTTEDALDLVLSDDIDSLASCMLLHKIKKNWNIKYFYDFENCYASTVLKKGHNARCWVDVAVLDEKAFDNHVSRISVWDDYNAEMINPNIIVDATNEDYADKYAGSTLLMLWSLYNIPLPETEEGKMLLLCIDSTFKGHYYEKFAEANQFYLCNMFEFGELYDVMERHTIDEFYELIDKYNLEKKIYMTNKGKLFTKMDLVGIGKLLGLNLCLSEKAEFVVWKEYEIIEERLASWCEYVKDVSNNIFTLAFTYKNSMRYSKLKS